MLQKTKIICVLFVLLCGCTETKAQQHFIITGNYYGEHFQRLADSAATANLHFYYDTEIIDSLLITFDTKGLSLDKFLTQLAAKTGIHYAIGPDGNVFLSQKFKIVTTLPAGLFNEHETAGTNDTAIVENIAPVSVKPQKQFAANRIYEIGNPSARTTTKAVLSGYVRDIKTGEAITGASLFIDSVMVGTSTDQYGYFTIIVPPGKHLLKITSTGMKETRRQLTVYSNGQLDIDMQEAVATLKAVVVTSEKSSNTRSLQMGTNRLNIKTIKQVPVAFGETDILKVVLTLPGVTSAGEAANGFNVRGGSADQNLILLNDATIYNPSHLFGLFSAFNADVVKGLELYKSAIPIKYGGRLSSVLDINMQDGNSKKWAGVAGIGPLTSKVMVEGPIKKEKTSFIMAARTTYSNWLLNLIPNEEYKNSRANFYDANLHLSHVINAKNNFYFTAYISKDKFNLANDTTYRYGNKNLNIKWKHFFSTKFSNIISAGIDDYHYNITSTENRVNAFKLGFNIRQLSFRSDASYTHDNKHQLSFGCSIIHYGLNPGSYTPAADQSLVKPNILQTEQGIEGAVYAGDNYVISSKISVNAGVRYSVYSYLGPRNVLNYITGLPKDTSTISDTAVFTSGKAIKTYQAPEIRVSLRYSFPGNASLKLSFNTMQQYIHMLSNTVTVSPTDIWKLSDSYLKPQQGFQISLGLYKNFKNNMYETSLELYYKRLNNFPDYKSGAKLLLNSHIETYLINTKGRAYGAELLVRKVSGRLNGWLSYAYSKTMLQQDDNTVSETINDGKYYPAGFDRPHNLNLICNYKFSHRYSLSLNFVYTTGRPITLPVAVFNTGGTNALIYSDRNQYRVPDYMRADISFTLEGNHKVKQKTHNSWSFGAYNITARRNPYSVYFKQENGKIKGYQLSIFGTIIPFVTYNIKF